MGAVEAQERATGRSDATRPPGYHWFFSMEQQPARPANGVLDLFAVNFAPAAGEVRRDVAHGRAAHALDASCHPRRPSMPLSAGSPSVRGIPLVAVAVACHRRASRRPLSMSGGV